MPKLPYYFADIAGEIERFDERDMVFARQDLVRYFGENSAEYRSYFENKPELESFHQKLSQKSPLGGKNMSDAPMFRAQFRFLDLLASDDVVDGTPVEQKTKFSKKRAVEKIKATARVYGADLVKIGPLDQRWVYSHVGTTAGNAPGYQPWGTPIDLSGHLTAIALGFRMDQDLLSGAPYFPTMLATAQAYAESAFTAVRLADYIRMLGFSARAHHFSNYQVLCVPIAVDCGMGELSRAGYLLTKEFGLGLRLSVVTTDMPLDFDEPVDIAAQSFCEQCQLCAQSCPSGAIPCGEKVPHNGVLKWKLDEQKCYAYWHVNGTDCGICMAVCPWTKPQTAFHRAMSWFASKRGPHQGWMAKGEQLVYGSYKPKEAPDYLD